MAQLEQEFTPVALQGEQYINLMTYRKNGNLVKTPVWFVEIDGTIYAKTDTNAYKVKRINHNSHVKFAACDARGNIHGETFNGMAEIHMEGSPVAQQVTEAMNQKYGWQVRGFDLFAKLRNRTYTYIKITPQ